MNGLRPLLGCSLSSIGGLQSCLSTISLKEFMQSNSKQNGVQKSLLKDVAPLFIKVGYGGCLGGCPPLHIWGKRQSSGMS